ncbi:MAG: cupin domain-containing protein [Gammaproteobacteria bacterium]|nr:cupin domain-containing protein [Gammaproteobacteria bacterium]
MKKPLLNLNEVELTPRPAAFEPEADTRMPYGLSMGQLASELGARRLGYNITAVPSGCAAFPRHNHHVNEEMFLILEGEGELQVGDDVWPVKPMDIIACPPGGPETAHQIRNTGEIELRFLAVSTRMSPEYVEYPDSGKFGVFADRVGGEGKRPRLSYLGREENSLDYWDGE